MAVTNEHTEHDPHRRCAPPPRRGCHRRSRVRRRHAGHQRSGRAAGHGRDPGRSHHLRGPGTCRRGDGCHRQRSAVRSLRLRGVRPPFGQGTHGTAGGDRRRASHRRDVRGAAQTGPHAARPRGRVRRFTHRCDLSRTHQAPRGGVAGNAGLRPSNAAEAADPIGEHVLVLEGAPRLRRRRRQRTSTVRSPTRSTTGCRPRTPLRRCPWPSGVPKRLAYETAVRLSTARRTT